jgi:hypothetical protein
MLLMSALISEIKDATRYKPVKMLRVKKKVHQGHLNQIKSMPTAEM